MTHMISGCDMEGTWIIEVDGTPVARRIEPGKLAFNRDGTFELHYGNPHPPPIEVKIAGTYYTGPGTTLRLVPDGTVFPIVLRYDKGNSCDQGGLHFSLKMQMGYHLKIRRT